MSAGSDDVRFAVLAAGNQSSQAHPKARQRQLEVGDLIRVDVGGVFGGYESDVARMAVVGQAAEVQRELYRNHRYVQRGAIELMRPGVRACDIFEYCVQAYEKLGIEYALPHVGHGFGLSGHEAPMLQPHETRELQPNMLICIEPAYFDGEGAGGYQVEDLVLITEDGAEILTTYSDTEELSVIR
jgi:Xaa-Pro aminopeptidase